MKKSAKVCWAIGLLIFQISITAIRYLTDYGVVYFISILSESIPTIGAIVLIFYDYKYNSPITGNFTLLRAWSIGLIWVQPAISFLSWSTAGLIDSVISTWIGSCVFIIISTILLVIDGKKFVKEKQNENSATETEEHNTDAKPLPELEIIDDNTSIVENTKNSENNESNDQQNQNEQHILLSNNAIVQASEQTEQENNSDDWFSEDHIPTPVGFCVLCIIGAAILVGIILLIKTL